jgi:hypothetical protein
MRTGRPNFPRLDERRPLDAGSELVHQSERTGGRLSEQVRFEPFYEKLYTFLGTIFLYRYKPQTHP